VVGGPASARGYQKLFYLPEPHTDFIFSVIGEELGLAGVLVIIGLYLLIVWKGIRIARHAPDLSVVTWRSASRRLWDANLHQHGRHAGPSATKGLTLPFLSYGGTSLVLNMATIGILMNISASGKTARGVG